MKSDPSARTFVSYGAMGLFAAVELHQARVIFKLAGFKAQRRRWAQALRLVFAIGFLTDFAAGFLTGEGLTAGDLD
jgi:hypothetical protein